jgi:putative NADPH-quinone reductase
MKLKKVLIILGHPLKDSLNGGLAEQYAEGARAGGHEVKTLFLGEMDFNPMLEKGYKEIQPLEPDLERAQELIKWADHVVLIYPTWWASMPALMKGFLDRTVLPGFAYHFKKNSRFWEQYLKGKSVRILSTMDSITLYIRWWLHNPGYHIVKGTLGFSGMSPIRTTYFGSVKFSSEKKRARWMKKVFKLGRKAK